MTGPDVLSLLWQAFGVGAITGAGLGLVVAWLVHEWSGCGRARAWPAPAKATDYAPRYYHVDTVEATAAERAKGITEKRIYRSSGV